MEEVERGGAPLGDKVVFSLGTFSAPVSTWVSESDFGSERSFHFGPHQWLKIQRDMYRIDQFAYSGEAKLLPLLL